MDHLPVAVFTDGFMYHKDIVTDDTLKREAIRRSGNFRVWSLSYKDVQSVFSNTGGLRYGYAGSNEDAFWYKNVSERNKKGRAESTESIKTVCI